MADLHPLADVGKHDGVLPHQIAGANGGKADGVAIPLAGDPLAAVDGALFQVTSERLGHHLPHGEGGAGRCIHLVSVVPLDDLDVGVIPHHPGGLLQQLEHQVDAHRVVGGEDDADLLARLFQGGLARIVKTGGADHHLLLVGPGESQVG